VAKDVVLKVEPNHCGQGLVEEILARAAALRDDLRNKSCIIFDWDDTLFPTWYVENVVKPSGLEEDPQMAALFKEAIAIHVAAVKDLLRTARELANVAIVTLATREWFQLTARTYWPDSDFEEFISDLEIPVYYAREHLTRAEKKLQAEGVDLFVVAKRNAMSRCLRKFSKKLGCDATNLISVGDAFAEHEAMKEVGWSMSSSTICKSILFLPDPPLCTLTDEINILTHCISRMVAAEDDFDWDMPGPSEMAWLLSNDPSA